MPDKLGAPASPSGHQPSASDLRSSQSGVLSAEREAIVRWMRGRKYFYAADAIERGEHLKERG